MSRRMALAALLPDVPGIDPALQVGGLTMDSRSVRAGDAFVAIAGFGAHGLAFVEQARACGAAAVLVDADDRDGPSVPADAIAVPGLRARLGALADAFFEAPTARVPVVGVTGTNGKTSTVQLLAQAWEALGTRTGTVGTLGAGLHGDVRPTGFTTPLVLHVHALLADMVDAGAGAIAMEVSSHALEQGRVDGVHFDIAAFTNLTRDHLDYHGDMQSYGAAKAKLFAWPGLRAAVINVDDAFGAVLRAKLDAALSPAPSPPLAGEKVGMRGASRLAMDSNAKGAFDHVDPTVLASDSAPLTPALSPASRGEGAEAQALRVISTSARGDASASIRARDITLDTAGVSFELSIGGTAARVQSPLLGRFNVDNLLVVAGVLHAQGLDATRIARVLSDLQPIHGRMNRLGGGDAPLVVIDYAHTPDALEQALSTLRAHTDARVACVFGCGGERDAGKRPQMGAIAERLADVAIVTDDNPRGEDGDAIVAQVLAGFADPARAIVVRDRRAAIGRAIAEARAGDIVLVAGKGHEPYQEIAGVQHPFDDTAVARDALGLRLPRPQDAEERPQHTNVQVARPQDAEERP